VDNNTRYFHQSTFVRRRQNKIGALQENDNSWIYDEDTLKQHVVNCYNSLYTSQGLNNSSFTTISTFPPLEKETLSILALLLPLIKLYSVWKVTSLQDPTDFILSSLKENGILLKGILDNSKDRENILCLSLTCLGIVYFFLS
jgi:hypothetical protein